MCLLRVCVCARVCVCMCVGAQVCMYMYTHACEDHRAVCGVSSLSSFQRSNSGHQTWTAVSVPTGPSISPAPDFLRDSWTAILKALMAHPFLTQ